MRKKSDTAQFRLWCFLMFAVLAAVVFSRAAAMAEARQRASADATALFFAHTFLDSMEQMEEAIAEWDSSTPRSPAAIYQYQSAALLAKAAVAHFCPDSPEKSGVCRALTFCADTAAGQLKAPAEAEGWKRVTAITHTLASGAADAALRARKENLPLPLALGKYCINVYENAEMKTADLPESSSRGYALLQEREILPETEIRRTAQQLLATSLIRRADNASFPPSHTYYTDNSMVEISRMGGFPLRFQLCRNIRCAQLTDEACIHHAHDYLSSLGLSPMEPTFIRRDSGIVTIYFSEASAPKPTFISVGADSGTIVAFDLTGYFHRAGSGR